MKNPVLRYIFAFFLAITIFSSTQGFGLRDTENSSDGLGFGNIGIFGLLQLVTLAIMFISLIISGKEYSLKSTSIGKSCKVYFFLYILICIQLLFQYILSGGVSGDLSCYANLLQMRYFLSFFITIVIARFIGRNLTFNIISLCAVIASVISLAVIVLNIGNTGIGIKINEYDITHALKIFIPAAPLAAFGYFYYLSSFMNKKNLVYLFFSVICFITVLVQLHRSTMLALLFTSVLFLLSSGKISIKKISVIAISFVLILIVGLYAFNLVGYSGEMFVENLEATSEGIQSGEDNNSLLRFLMLENAFEYVISHYVIFGIGLDWAPLDFDTYIKSHFAATPVFDSSYYNIIIVFGLLGVILFFKVLFSYISSMLIILRDKNTYYKPYAKALFFSMLYFLMTAFGGDLFLVQPPGVTVFYTVLALAHILNVDYGKLYSKNCC